MKGIVHRKRTQPSEETPTDSADSVTIQKEKKGKRPRKARNWTCCVVLALCVLVAAVRPMILDPGKSLRAEEATYNTPTTADSTNRTLDPLNNLAPSAVAASHYESRRFPQYGAPEFSEKCPWVTTELGQGDHSCTIVSQPSPNGTEGIASWVRTIVQGFIVAQQAGCQFRFGHDPAVDLSQVLSNQHGFNWTMPPDLPCDPVQNCFRFSPFKAPPLGTKRGPKYRFVYSHFVPGPHHFDYLKDALHGFSFETGMACSLAGLFRFAPSASHFEPLLFEKILPTLHEPNALVMALYVRTGHADDMAAKETSGQNHTDLARIKDADDITKCALELENDLLIAEPEYSKVVWMLVSDSPVTKQWAIEKYHGQNVVPARHQKNGTTILREIVTTRARGVHTRTRRRVSTTDFAEAFIDWYLLGESDVVLTSAHYTFGALGALRTARPLYRGCVKASPVKKPEAATV